MQTICFFLLIAFSQVLFAETNTDLINAVSDIEARAKTKSHCVGSERVVFTCKIKNKVASICASNDFGSNSGYMQYRFGRIGSPEVIIPKKTDAHHSKIAYKYFEQGNGGTAIYIRFSEGSYQYYIYSVSFRGDDDPKTGVSTWVEPSGVYVTKVKQTVYSQKCTSRNLVLEQSEFLWKNSINEINDTDDNVDPSDFAYQPKP